MNDIEEAKKDSKDAVNLCASINNELKTKVSRWVFIGAVTIVIGILGILYHKQDLMNMDITSIKVQSGEMAKDIEYIIKKIDGEQKDMTMTMLDDCNPVLKILRGKKEEPCD